MSPDNAAFGQSTNVPGASVFVTDALRGTPGDVLSQVVSPICTMTNLTTYETPSGLVGPMYVATACGGTLSSEVTWVAPLSDSRVVVLKLRLVTERDRQAASALLESI